MLKKLDPPVNKNEMKLYVLLSKEKELAIEEGQILFAFHALFHARISQPIPATMA